MQCFHTLHRKVETFIGGAFGRYGKFVANHPWKIIVVVVIVEIGLGLGLLWIEKESGIEQYAPTGSEASINKKSLKSLFKVNTSENFYRQSLDDLGLYAEVIVELKSGGNILDYSYWEDLLDLFTYVEHVSTTDLNGNLFAYRDVCARVAGHCATEGSIFFKKDFITDLNGGSIWFPSYNLTTGQWVNLDKIIGGVTVTLGRVSSAKSLKFRFNLQKEQSDLASMWEKAFLSKITLFSNNNISIEYSTSQSLSEELSKNVSGDISLFSVTFTLVIVFACLTLMGSNCVDNRYNLGLAGVLSTGLAILGSFGLCSLIGVKFVDIVGAMPFLILGIGVDDMFILLSGLADTNSNDDVPTRISATMRTSGVAITITSLTNIIAFCAGVGSVFPSVRSFCWYTGCAILFCYLNYVTFFVGVMTINEKRVSRNRHWFTCCKIKTREESVSGNKPKAVVVCCSGQPRRTREEVEGPLEKYPKRVFKCIVLFTPAKIVVLLLFCGYLGVSIWGATNFREDLDLRDLVSKDSYHHRFYDFNHRMFSQSLIVSLNIYSTVNYRSPSTLTSINTLLENVKDDVDMEDDFQLSWLHTYMTSPVYDNSSDVNFIRGLDNFLTTDQGNLFINDVTINGSSIVASRFYVKSTSLLTSSLRVGLMIRLRRVVKKSNLPVFVYSPAFVFFEQYTQIFPQTFQTLGICVSVVLIVTAFFMPLPVLIILVTLSVAMIMVGVIGFMYFWDLTLSSVTMIHIIMCVGFSVDFSTHICHAFVQAEGPTKNQRVATAIDRSGGPILNGAISSVIGIMMLGFSKSYVFFSFFKVMFIVIVLGAMHAMLLLPVILSLIGPKYVVTRKSSSEGDAVDDGDIDLNSQKERNGTHEKDRFIM